MTNETAIKFTEICRFKNPRKCEITGYIEEYVTVEDVVQGKATQADFASPRRFMPDCTDDVLALAIEWCEKNIEDFIRIELLIYSKKELSKDSECGLYLCTILQETDCDSGYGKTMVSVLDGEVFVDGNSPSQAIMLAVIKAAEGL